MTDKPAALPWAQVAHWVMLAPISREAKLVYVYLVMHVLRSNPANRLAWPSRERLAALAGFAKAEAIDPRVRELERIGAVIVDRGRHPRQPLRRRNTYTVRLPVDGAPEGYFGALSVWEVKDHLDGDEAPDDGGPSSGGSGRSSEPVEVPEVPPEGVREAPLQGSRDTPPEGPEVEVVDGDTGDEEVALPALVPRAGAACEYALCRGGVLKIGINERPCPKCSVAA